MSTLQLLQQREVRTNETRPASSVMPCERAFTQGTGFPCHCVERIRCILSPITDALHLWHGPAGCAVHARDANTFLSSGSQLYRFHFSTNLQDADITDGGKKKLYRSLTQLIYTYSPKAAFVYFTCVLEANMQDVSVVCKRVAKENGIPVLPVLPLSSAIQKQNDEYIAACELLFTLIERKDVKESCHHSINILGEYNIGGDAWVIKEYYEQMGIQVMSLITGDGRIDDFQQAHRAALNVVHRPEMLPLAEMMQGKYDIPYLNTSFWGIDETSKALHNVGVFFSDDARILQRAQALIDDEVRKIYPQLQKYRQLLRGKKAGIYIDDAFTAIALIHALQFLEIEIPAIGVKGGSAETYEELKGMCHKHALLKPSIPLPELAAHLLEREIDFFIGEIKEKAIMQKLGIGYCQHEHARILPFTGYRGMLNLAREVYAIVYSPVWDFSYRRQQHFPRKVTQRSQGHFYRYQAV